MAYREAFADDGVRYEARHEASDDGRVWRPFDAKRDNCTPPLMQRFEFTFLSEAPTGRV
jgi:hypothetical protein